MSETESQLYNHLRKMLDEVEAKIDNWIDHPVRLEDETSHEFLQDYIESAEFCEKYFQRSNHRVKLAKRLQNFITDGY